MVNLLEAIISIQEQLKLLLTPLKEGGLVEELVFGKKKPWKNQVTCH